MLKDKLDKKVQQYEKNLSNPKTKKEKSIRDSAIRIWEELEKHFDTAQAEELVKGYEIYIYVFLNNKGEEYDYGYMIPGDVYIKMRKFGVELEVSSCTLDEVIKIAEKEGIQGMHNKSSKYEKVWKFFYKK